jgi:p21-activated kinase 1
MQTVDATKAPGFHNPMRRPGPPPLAHTSPDMRTLTPALRQSSSFTSGDRANDVTSSPTEIGSLSSASSVKRYSDEASGPKTRWRKKSTGISGFMSSVLGSPRNVKISAPENPVHMIHVGYDNETGQFTVSLLLP